MVDSAARTRSALVAVALAATLVGVSAGAAGGTIASVADGPTAPAPSDPAPGVAPSPSVPEPSPVVSNDTDETVHDTTDDVTGTTDDVTEATSDDLDEATADVTDDDAVEAEVTDATDADAPDSGTRNDGTLDGDGTGAGAHAVDPAAGASGSVTDVTDANATVEPATATRTGSNATADLANATDPASPTARGTPAVGPAWNATAASLATAHTTVDAPLAEVSGLADESIETVGSLGDALLATVDDAEALLGVDTDVSLDARDALDREAALADEHLREDARAPLRATVGGPAGDGRGGPESGEPPDASDGDDAGSAARPAIDRAVDGRDVPPGWQPTTPQGAAGLGIAVALLAIGRRLVATASPSAALVRPPVQVWRPSATAVEGDLRHRIRLVLSRLGYRRYDDSDPLAHDARAAIYEYLEDEPGTYLSEISDETGVALPTVRYHLKILAHENLVQSRKLRGKRRYFPAGTEPSALAAALDDDGAGTVLEALAEEGPTSVSELAEAVGLDTSTVSYHLQALEADDLVEREREGSAVVNRLPPSVETVLNGDGAIDS